MKKEKYASNRPVGQTPSAVGKSLEMNLEARQGGMLVLHCEGKLIYQQEAQRLSSIVSEVLPSAGRMVVDLAGVKDVDSSGLSELVMAHMWADAAGFDLRFAGPNKTVRYLLELTNLVSVFDIYPSVPEAVAAMHGEDRCSA